MPFFLLYKHLRIILQQGSIVYELTILSDISIHRFYISALDSSNPMDDLKIAQSKERKELQAKITAMKHSIPKNDKKKKKEIMLQIQELEDETKRRHESQIKELEQSLNGMTLVNGTNINTEAQPEACENLLDEPTPFFKEIKLSKVQQKKENKRKKKAESRVLAAEQDEANASRSEAIKEREAMELLLEQRGYQLVEIAPDGDCLYSALSHQCSSVASLTHSASMLRKMAADYIRKHSDDFLPFLVDEEGDPLAQEGFGEYCNRVNWTSAQGGSWGGEPELRAISSALEHRIEVLHADGRTTLFGEQFTGPSLLITFHKHAYTLGEHYNSTEAITS